MKKRIITLSAIMTMLVTFAQAQTATVGRTTFGLRAGVNFQNINGKEDNGDDTDNKLKTGFHVGVNAEIPLAPDFYIQPGVLFSTKGAKEKSSDAKLNLSYIEVPINLLYKPVLGGGKLLLGFGPYVAFAVNGKIKNGSNEQDIAFTNTVKISDPAKPYFKRFDAGANFLAGYELSSNLSLQLNAQLGLTKINPKYEGVSNDKTKYKNTGFGLSLGYRF